MVITDIFLRYKKEVETSDKQRDENLKTHYYKGSVNQIFEMVEEIISHDADSRIITISKERGEIAVEINKPFPCFMVVSIVSAKPLETAVDFTISTEKISLLGVNPALRKRIISFYDRIDKRHS
jgi:hypothetical protein